MPNSANSHKGTEALKLRAHHICCSRFIRTVYEERGSVFNRLRDKIKSVLLSQPESMVMVIEGVDELCQQCPQYVDGHCGSSRGDEDAVRKWDAILLRELEIPLGTCLTSGEWKALIEQKTPFKLCQKCQWKPACNVGADSL